MGEVVSRISIVLECSGRRERWPKGKTRRGGGRRGKGRISYSTHQGVQEGSWKKERRGRMKSPFQTEDGIKFEIEETRGPDIKVSICPKEKNMMSFQ